MSGIWRRDLGICHRDTEDTEGCPLPRCPLSVICSRRLTPDARFRSQPLPTPCSLPEARSSKPVSAPTMTPKPYRWADQATGILLLVAVVFAPWAFGATQEWSIRTLNAVGYVMGGLLAFKWLVRWKVDFEPTRWNDGRGRKWPVRALAAVTVLILVYVLVSALNARARIDYTYQPGQAAATGIDTMPCRVYTLHSGNVQRAHPHMKARGFEA